MHLDLTIAIPVRNEEINLPGCLRAIGTDFAKQIIVIDSQSTDKTKLIAESFGAKVIDFNWDGKFPKKRNWYLRHHTPYTKWIMFLDADEYLTLEFKNELRQLLKNSENVGYWLKYSIYFMGERLKGGYPLYKLALFQVGLGEYEKIDEEKWSNLDMEVHEHPILEGKVGTVKSKIDHRDFRGISHYIRKHDDYSSWEAYRYIKFKTNKEFIRSLTFKQRIKYSLMNTPLVGPFFFFGSFLVMGGFLDGVKGFVFASLKASYFTQIYCKIKELERGT